MFQRDSSWRIFHSRPALNRRRIKNYSDSEVAEITHRVTTAAYFDRLTEAAGLQLEA